MIIIANHFFIVTGQVISENHGKTRKNHECTKGNME